MHIFGFVFHRGVKTNASFDKKYAAYPTVRGWTDQGESSPWTLAFDDGTPFTPQNFYHPSVDMSRLVVTGNRTGTGATYNTPEDWSTYKHPEGVTGFQTRYWQGGSAWNATAQQHYLRIAGVPTDYRTGDLGARYHVLQHEMGHCFFLDDLYDSTKYPQPLPRCACSASGSPCLLKPDETVMFAAKGLTALDHAMLRHVWLYQKERFLS